MTMDNHRLPMLGVEYTDNRRHSDYDTLVPVSIEEGGEFVVIEYFVRGSETVADTERRSFRSFIMALDGGDFVPVDP